MWKNIHMKAIVWTKYGPPDALQLKDVETPAPKEDEVLIKIHAATVSTADGTAVAFYKRDPKEFRALAKRAARNYRRLGQEWDQLKRVYRAALPELTSTEAWRKVFEAQR